MTTIKLAFRSLNGELQHLAVEKNTRISALKSKVGAVPHSPFHEVRFLGNGEARVLSGTISEAGLESGSEITIVQVVNLDAAIDEVCDCVWNDYNDHQRAGRFWLRQRARRFWLAMRLLSEFDEFPEEQEERLLSFLEQFWKMPLFVEDFQGEVLKSIGDLIARTCRCPWAVVSRLCVSPVFQGGQQELREGARVLILNTLGAICRRDKQALTDERMVALVESQVRFLGNGITIPVMLPILSEWGGASALRSLRALPADPEVFTFVEEHEVRNAMLQIEQRLQAAEQASTVGPLEEHAEWGEAEQGLEATRLQSLAHDTAAHAADTPSLPEAEAETDPVMEEQKDLQKALVLSKADRPIMPISYDDSVVILRLTRCCKEILHALHESPVLRESRKRVEEAGCSFSPRCAGGAFLLIPLTDAQLSELGLQLEKYHIVALRSDKPAIDEALRCVTPAIRPKMRDDHRAGERKEAVSTSGPSTAQNPCSTTFQEIELHGPRVQEVAQFHQLHPRIRELMLQNVGISEPSDVTVSAPCGESSYVQPWNPRHYDLKGGEQA